MGLNRLPQDASSASPTRTRNMDAISTTVDRVPRHTGEDINRRIQQDINDRVRQLAQHPTGIDRRLRELDEEWDIERALEANAASAVFTGTLLAATVDKRWLALPALV